MQVVDSYPGDAAKGADYLTGAAQRDLVVDPNLSVADGGIRKERIVLTDLYLDHEGRVCISETSVQHMANLLGMFEGERVLRIIADNEALRAEVGGQQALVVGLQNRIAGLETNAATQYVGLDGKGYATLDGARAATAEPIEPPHVVDPTLADVEQGDAPEPPKRSDEDQAEIEHLHKQLADAEAERDAANEALTNALKSGDGGGVPAPPEDGKDAPPPEPGPKNQQQDPVPKPEPKKATKPKGK